MFVFTYEITVNDRPVSVSSTAVSTDVVVVVVVASSALAVLRATWVDDSGRHACLAGVHLGLVRGVGARATVGVGGSGVGEV